MALLFFSKFLKKSQKSEHIQILERIPKNSEKNHEKMNKFMKMNKFIKKISKFLKIQKMMKKFKK